MRPLLLALVSLLLSGSVLAGDFDLPAVRLSPGPQLLRVVVVPADGSHLAPDLPLVVRLEDGYFDVQTSMPDVPESGPATVQVPLFREKRITAWAVLVEGAACADDGSTCVPFHLDLTIERGSDRLAGVHSTMAGRSNALAPPPPPAPPGRVKRDGPKGKKDADGGTTPVLYDFFATWCPPCDRLRDEFLEHPDWQELLAGYEVVSLDADKAESFALKDRFRVGGYPTVILTDGDGVVLERIVGFPGADEVARRLEAAREPTTADGCAAAIGAMRRAVARDEPESAWAALTDGCERPLRDLSSDPASLMTAFQLAKSLDHTDEAIRFGAAFATTAPDLGAAAYVAHSTAGLLSTAARAPEAEALKELVTRRVDAAVDASGKDVDADIALATALWYRGRWEPARTAELHARGAELLASVILRREGVEAKPGQPVLPDALLGLSTRLRQHEGVIHDLLDLVVSSGQHDVAGRLFSGMLTLFPEEFTWHNKKAGWLQKRGMIPEAVRSARDALTHAYGDNRLRAAHRLASLLGPGDEALAVITEALAAPEPSQEHVRTWRYRKALVELRDQYAQEEPR